MTRLAIVTVVVAAMGAVSGAGPATGSQNADATLAYTCGFPSAARPVSLRVTATFPATGAVNQPIQPTDVTAKVTIPQAALADLTELDAATVTGTAELTTTVTQNGTSTDAAWPDLAAPSAPIPDSGDFTLLTSGEVPPITVNEDGDVTITVGDLTLVLTPKKADGSATNPATMPLACTLAPDQDATLAVVAVSSTGTTPPSVPSAPGTAGSTAPGQPKSASPGTTPDGTFSGGPEAAGQARPPAAQPRASASVPIDVSLYTFCADIWNAPPVPPGGFAVPYRGGLAAAKVDVRAMAAGYSNVNKLNGATLLGPALLEGFPPDAGLRFWIGAIPPGGNQFFNCQVAHLRLQHNGRREFPPAQATFATFSLMPVTATVHLTQTGPITAVTYEQQPSINNPFTAVVTSRISLRLSDVTVNGEPLDVGPRCQTTRPLYTPDSPVNPNDDLVVLVGGRDPRTPPIIPFPTPPFVSLPGGGALAGMTTIPPFTGCGVGGEDLDPLLTATISGPANFTKLVQGTVCQPSGGDCPPGVPEPSR